MNEEEKRIFEEERRLRQKYNVLFSSPTGKEVLDDLKELFFYKKSTLIPSQVGEAGELPICYNEGQRMVVMHIEDMMELADEVADNSIQEGQSNPKEEA